jgi:hypothetical protein
MRHSHVDEFGQRNQHRRHAAVHASNMRSDRSSSASVPVECTRYVRFEARGSGRDRIRGLNLQRLLAPAPGWTCGRALAIRDFPQAAEFKGRHPVSRVPPCVCKRPANRTASLAFHIYTAQLQPSQSFAGAGSAVSELQRPQKGDQIALLLNGELCLQHQIEELHGVLECQAPAVVHVRRTFLDTA